ncbi:MAG: hypothetical protein NTX50_16820, partial [Candidatus Sumerlaeota bacterium]|nr:hypothetical protein [Candidatus Sumerlaeota bacterium]
CAGGAMILRRERAIWRTIIAPLAQGPVVAAREKRTLLEQNQRSTGTRPGGGVLAFSEKNDRNS